jgi:Flp pilus assembly protein TadG
MELNGCRRAQSALEFALVLPLFLLLAVGTIEFGRLFFSYAELLQAAQTGVRYGAVLGNYYPEQSMIDVVKARSPGGTSDTVTISSVTSPTDSTVVAPIDRLAGNVLTVQVDHTHTVLMPLLSWTSIPLTATASMMIE